MGHRPWSDFYVTYSDVTELTTSATFRLARTWLPRSLLVIAILLIVAVDRAQEMGENPLGHEAALLPRQVV
jgi:hypothetical protein